LSQKEQEEKLADPAKKGLEMLEEAKKSEGNSKEGGEELFKSEQSSGGITGIGSSEDDDAGTVPVSAPTEESVSSSDEGTGESE